MIYHFEYSGLKVSLKDIKHYYQNNNKENIKEKSHKLKPVCKNRNYVFLNFYDR